MCSHQVTFPSFNPQEKQHHQQQGGNQQSNKPVSAHSLMNLTTSVVQHMRSIKGSQYIKHAHAETHLDVSCVVLDQECFPHGFH